MREDTNHNSVKEAAYMLNLKPGTVRNYIHSGKLRPIRVKGKRPFFTTEYLKGVMRDGYETVSPKGDRTKDFTISERTQRNHKEVNNG